MRRIIAIALSACLVLSMAGCGSNWTTIEANGYSYEVDANWENESQGYYFFSSGDGGYFSVSVTEYGSSELALSDYSLSDQQRELARLFEDSYYEAGNGDILEWVYENVQTGMVGEHAMASATFTQYFNGEASITGSQVVFFASSDLKVSIWFQCFPVDYEIYKPQFEHVINSIKLV